MSKNRPDVGPPPQFIRCDPLSRDFPEGWKDIIFRRSIRRDNGVCYYTCPICRKNFDHSSIDHLHGDHVWPYSLFGATKWENYQLICGNCNSTKGNRLNREVRRVLGTGSFHNLVATFLQEKIETGALTEDAVLRSILAAPVSGEFCQEPDQERLTYHQGDLETIYNPKEEDKVAEDKSD
jgi:5-methylcytosine-specific restriction endonuclease McrA